MEIEADQVSFFYGDKNVLSELNFVAEQGESIGILGSSGCGKSTFLKLLAGLYEPSSGSILVAGQTGAGIRKKVAMVMQSAMLLPATIKENITCGHEMKDSWLQEVCDAAQLSGWIRTLPKGWDTYLGERGMSLSGGQAQRVSIARAMAKQADVILLDEATSALDADTSEAVMEALNQLTKGKTAVHVTHHPELLLHCNRIYHMEGGRLLEKRIV